MSKSTTKVTCPKCGTEFKIADKTSVAIGIVIGKDSNLGEIHPETEQAGSHKITKAKERIEALKAAGVDVSNLFAMQGANGEEMIAKYNGVRFDVLDENDPIFNAIRKNGDIPNRKLFRRWVMAQMFRMLYAETNPECCRTSYNEKLHRLGYNYQWTMLENELYAQWKMYKHNDNRNFIDRNRWFNKGMAVQMANEYTNLLNNYIDGLPTHTCKKIPYKRINGKNMFTSDIYNKVVKGVYRALTVMLDARTPEQLYKAVVLFNQYRVKLPSDTIQHKVWIDAYKGSGAFFTLQNMIRFHGCILRGKNGRMLSKDKSLEYLGNYAEECGKNGEGYKMLGMLRQALKDNRIDINAKFQEWASKRNN